MTWQDKLIKEIFPFLPWVLVLFSISLSALALIWGLRRLGKPNTKNRDVSLRTRNSDGDLEPGLIPLAEPSSQMIILRTTQLRQMLDEDEKLVEFTLRSHFEAKDFDELCLFLRHFGPGYLNVFRERAELTEVLGELSQEYSEFDKPETPSEHWDFLDRLERKMTSAKVKINNQPLTDEFAFLGSISVDELMGLLKGVSDLEAVATIAYSPALLREEFFTIAPPALTSKIVEQLTKVDRLPDSFVRETAQKLRKHYNDHSKDLKTVRVDRTPLLEMALNHLDEGSRKKLVDELRRDDPEAVKRLAPSIFLDECLRFLENDMITDIFLEVAPKDAAAYLHKFEWKKEVIEKMNERLKDSINKFVQSNYQDDPASSRARVRIAKFVRLKSTLGAIDLDTINKNILGS